MTPMARTTISVVLWECAVEAMENHIVQLTRATLARRHDNGADNYISAICTFLILRNIYN